MNISPSTTQSDDDVFASWADSLRATGGHYTSAQHGALSQNLNAANDMTFSPASIASMETFATLLTQENYMCSDIPDLQSILAQPFFDASSVDYQPVGNPDPRPIPAQPLFDASSVDYQPVGNPDPWSIPPSTVQHTLPPAHTLVPPAHLSGHGIPPPAQPFDASSVAYQPVGNPNLNEVSLFATDSVAATFSEGMSPNDSLISPTSADEWAFFSEPGGSTCTTPSSSYGSGVEASWVAPEYGANTFGSTTTPAEWTGELSWPIPATTSIPTVGLGKRPREAEEPHGDGGRVETHQIPPEKRARSDEVSNGIPKAARSTARTRHKPVAKRIPNPKFNGKPEAAGRGAERLASPNSQGIYHRTLLGPLQQGWVEEAANGTPIRVEERVDEKVVHQQQQEEEKFLRNLKKLKPMHKALLNATKTASGVRDIKCLLCPQTHLKSLQDFKRHCNTAEAHPLEIAFCDACGDFFARKDSLLRHQETPPPECRECRGTTEEAERKREKAKIKRRETKMAHEDFLSGLEEYLKAGNLKDFVPFSKIIKDKYPESSKKRRAGGSK